MAKQSIALKYLCRRASILTHSKEQRQAVGPGAGPSFRLVMGIQCKALCCKSLLWPCTKITLSHGMLYRTVPDPLHMSQLMMLCPHPVNNNPIRQEEAHRHTLSSTQPYYRCPSLMLRRVRVGSWLTAFLFGMIDCVWNFAQSIQRSWPPPELILLT